MLSDNVRSEKQDQLLFLFVLGEVSKRKDERKKKKKTNVGFQMGREVCSFSCRSSSHLLTTLRLHSSSRTFLGSSGGCGLALRLNLRGGGRRRGASARRRVVLVGAAGLEAEATGRGSDAAEAHAGTVLDHELQSGIVGTRSLVTLLAAHHDLELDGITFLPRSIT